MEQLNIPFSMFQQDIPTNAQRMVATFPYENYVFVYLWSSNFLGTTLNSSDQVALTITNNRNSVLSFSHIATQFNETLSVVKYCDILNISVVAVDVQTDLLNIFGLFSDIDISINSLRFANRSFLTFQDNPFTASFSINRNTRNMAESIDFEIHEIDILLSDYRVSRVNVPNDQFIPLNIWDFIVVGQFMGGSLDLFFWDFNAPVPIDNIHAATFNFTESQRRRQHFWGNTTVSDNTTHVPHENVVINPGTYHHPNFDIPFQYFSTGDDRANEFAQLPNSNINHSDFDFSILIHFSGYYSSSFLGQGLTIRTDLTQIALIELVFESDGKMYKANVDLENGPVENTDDFYVGKNTATLSWVFVLITSSIIGLFFKIIPIAGKYIFFGVVSSSMLAWFLFA